MSEYLIFPAPQHRPNFNCPHPEYSGQIGYLSNSHRAIDVNPSHRLLISLKKRQQLAKICHVTNYGKQFVSHGSFYQIHQSRLWLSREGQRPTRIPTCDLAKRKTHIALYWLVLRNKLVDGTSISPHTLYAE